MLMKNIRIPSNVIKTIDLVPQAAGKMVRDAGGTVFGIATPDGRSVLLTAPLAHQFALEILSITSITLTPQKNDRKQ